MVFQNPNNQFVSSVVKEDIEFSLKNYNIDYDDSTISKALSLVGLENFENRDIYSLSGGQKQRLALAGILCVNPDIIILDEATAFADAENEHQIQLAFEGLTSGKTVLMIAHRLSTIQDADMILVFGDGKIIERGNHDELLKQNGVYASMWKEYQTQIIWKVGTTVRKEENHD